MNREQVRLFHCTTRGTTKESQQLCNTPCSWHWRMILKHSALQATLPLASFKAYQEDFSKNATFWCWHLFRSNWSVTIKFCHTESDSHTLLSQETAILWAASPASWHSCRFLCSSFPFKKPIDRARFQTLDFTGTFSLGSAVYMLLSPKHTVYHCAKRNSKHHTNIQRQICQKTRIGAFCCVQIFPFSKLISFITDLESSLRLF